MKLKKISIFLSIPFLTLFCYAATVLMQYGYLSYFNIPSSFLESSLKDNIIYFFILFKVAFSIIRLLNWWLLLVLLPFILVWAILYNPYSWRRFIYMFVPILLLVSLWFSYDFGYKLASYNENFNIVDSECVSLDKNVVYIIPDIYDTKLILVPVDKATNKLKDGFFVKNSAEINCAVGYQHIGKIIR